MDAKSWSVLCNVDAGIQRQGQEQICESERSLWPVQIGLEQLTNWKEKYGSMREAVGGVPE